MKQKMNMLMIKGKIRNKARSLVLWFKSVLNLGQFCSPGDFWQCLEMCLVVSTG